jgi:hypothetical protein
VIFLVGLTQFSLSPSLLSRVLDLVPGLMDVFTVECGRVVKHTDRAKRQIPMEAFVMMENGSMIRRFALVELAILCILSEPMSSVHPDQILCSFENEELEPISTSTRYIYQLDFETQVGRL